MKINDYSSLIEDSKTINKDIQNIGKQRVKDVMTEKNTNQLKNITLQIQDKNKTPYIRYR